MLKLTPSALLLISLPLINFGPIPGGKLTFAHVISFVMLVVWAVRGKLRTRHQSFGFGLVFLSILTGNVLAGAIRTNNLDQFTQLLNYGFMMGVMLVAYTLAMRRDILPLNILEDYFRLGVIYASISLMLYVVGIFHGDLLYAITDFFNIANTFNRGGLSVELTDALLPRITGLSPEPSFWSIYLCTVLSVGFLLGRKLWTPSMLFIALVMLLTIARTGMVVFAFMILYQTYRRAPIAVLLGLCILLIIFFFNVKFDYTDTDLSIIQRFDSLFDGWNAFLQSPILGIGWGGFREYSLANNLDYPLIFNYYLQVAAEGGVVGLVSLLLFLISLVVNVQRNARIVLLAIFVAWLSAPAYNLAYVWYLFGILLASRQRQLQIHRTLGASISPLFSSSNCHRGVNF